MIAVKRMFPSAVQPERFLPFCKNEFNAFWGLWRSVSLTSGVQLACLARPDAVSPELRQKLRRYSIRECSSSARTRSWERLGKLRVIVMLVVTFGNLRKTAKVKT